MNAKLTSLLHRRQATLWRTGVSVAIGTALLGSAAQARPQAAAHAAPVQQAAPPPSAAPNFLAQMQDAVAEIVGRVQGAVVSVEGRPAFIALPLPGPGKPSPNGGAEKGRSLSPQERAQQALQDAWKNGDLEALQGMSTLFTTPTIGSGFLVQGGFVVTTAEVTEGMRDFVAVLQDGRRLPAEWVNTDPSANVSVLKLKGADPKTGLGWGDSDRVLPGHFAITIGNQAGFRNSVSLGLIAGIGRAGQSRQRRYQNLLQFQGAVGGGSSGGPVLNAFGEVVGMIVASAAGAVPRRLGSGEQEGDRMGALPAPDAARAVAGNKAHRVRVVGAQMPPGNAEAQAEARNPGAMQANIVMFGAVANTGFALPSNELKRVTIVLMERKRPQASHPGWLGVWVPPGQDMNDTPNGAFIPGIYPDSPAEKAGLQPDDIIVSLNGKLIRTEQDLREFSKHLEEGQSVRIEVQRGEATLAVLLKVEARPPASVLNRLAVRKAR